MKKILCALLTIVMLAAMIPSFAVSASAEDVDELTGKINVTHVSSTDTTTDWSLMWNTDNTTRLSNATKQAAEYVGKFDEPTKVTDIVILSHYYPSRISGTTIQFSEDGENWDDAALTVPSYSNSDSTNGNQQFNFSVTTEKEYSYVKVSTTKTAHSNGNYYFDIWWIAFYNNPYDISADSFEKVYAVSQNSKAETKDASVLWDYSNETAVQWGNNSSDNVMITGEFVTPTVIDNIYFKLQSGNGARCAYVSVQASVDGSSWDQIAYTSTLANSTSRILLESTSQKAYKFIKLVKKNTYTFGMVALGILGTAQTPETNTTEADFYGVQTSVGESDWSLRLISTVDSLDFKAVGYEIKVTGDAERTWDKYTQVVYSSVVDNLGTRYAEPLGGKYIFTATIHGISIESYDTLTFEIKPYVADENGVKSYGETVTYTFVDGVAQ